MYVVVCRKDDSDPWIIWEQCESEAKAREGLAIFRGLNGLRWQFQAAELRILPDKGKPEAR